MHGSTWRGPKTSGNASWSREYEAVWKRSLPPELPKNLLIIGVVAGVRHILVAGAQLTITTPTDATEAARRSLMFELSVDAIIVFLFLLLGSWPRSGFRSDSEERA
jgi:hypothetical protein